MGYSCTITSDKVITALEVQKIIDRLPNNLQGYVPSTINDVNLDPNDSTPIVITANKFSWDGVYFRM